MKILTHTLALLSILFFASCATPSSKLLELAKPEQAKAPTTKVIETRVVNVSKGVNNASAKLDLAHKNIDDLENQVVESDKINTDFKEAIKELSEEKQAIIDSFRKRYEDLAARSKQTIASLKSELDEARFAMQVLKIEVSSLESDVNTHKMDVERARAETVRLRLLYDEVIDMKATDETYKERAESRKKYVWFFWCLIIFVILAILAQIKFRIL